MHNLHRPLALAGVAACLIALCFAAWWGVERQLGPDLSAQAQTRLHLVRGVSTSFVAALFVLYWSERRIRAMEASWAQREKQPIPKVNDSNGSQKLPPMGDVAAGLAHEIKNPLAGIAAAIQVLDDTLPEEDERKPVVGKVLDEVKRIDRTLRDLLTFARPKAAKLEPTDLHDVIDQALAVVTILSGDRIEIVRHFAADLPRALVDSELFGQVLTHLVANAVQAMGAGGTLTVTTCLGADAVRIGVRDTGPGIGPTELEHVFEPFYTTKNRGTGLGLPICRRIVEAHHGNIFVESKPGSGAEFVIVLPYPTEKDPVQPSGATDS